MIFAKFYTFFPHQVWLYFHDYFFGFFSAYLMVTETKPQLTFSKPVGGADLL